MSKFSIFCATPFLFMLATNGFCRHILLRGLISFGTLWERNFVWFGNLIIILNSRKKLLISRKTCSSAFEVLVLGSNCSNYMASFDQALLNIFVPCCVPIAHTRGKMIIYTRVVQTTWSPFLDGQKLAILASGLDRIGWIALNYANFGSSNHSSESECQLEWPWFRIHLLWSIAVTIPELMLTRAYLL